MNKLLKFITNTTYVRLPDINMLKKQIKKENFILKKEEEGSSLYVPRMSPKAIRLATTVWLLRKTKKKQNKFKGLLTLSQMFAYVNYGLRDTSKGLMKLTETPSILVLFYCIIVVFMSFNWNSWCSEASGYFWTEQLLKLVVFKTQTILI